MPPTHLRFAAAAAVAALALVGCGGDDDAGGSSATTAAGGAAPDLVVHAKDSLEFDEELYQASAGEIVIEYVADGSLPHTLVVEDHEDDMRLEVQASEDSGSIELPAGDYVIYCDIAGHRAGGMQARLQVEA
jgi:plastocyanin